MKIVYSAHVKLIGGAAADVLLVRIKRSRWLLLVLANSGVRAVQFRCSLAS